MNSHLIPILLKEGVNIPILNMKKLRLRAAQRCVQGQAALHGVAEMEARSEPHICL